MSEEHPALRSLHKALADPLRMRLWEAVLLKPRSARELAAVVHVTANRLYHHLGQLVDAELLEVSEYRPLPGGKVERVYSATKREPPGDGATPEDVARFLSAMLATTRMDIEAACSAKADGARREILLAGTALRLSAAGFSALREDIERALQAARGRRDEGPMVRVLWTLIDLEDRGSD